MPYKGCYLGGVQRRANRFCGSYYDGLLTPNGSGKMFATATSTDAMVRAFYNLIGYQWKLRIILTLLIICMKAIYRQHIDIASTVEFPIS